VLAGYLGNGKLGQELARSVEVGHLQVGCADAVGIVRVRSRAARQTVPVGELSGTPVQFLVLDLSAGFQLCKVRVYLRNLARFWLSVEQLSAC
jgi:hypothetical protein